MNLLSKLIIVPQILFGVSFNRGKQPYQDFATLVSIRNDIVHHKMEANAPKYLRVLEERKIAISTKNEQANYPWMLRLSCTEGIRWAHNTACKMVQQLADFVPRQQKNFLVPLAFSFREISKIHEAE